MNLDRLQRDPLLEAIAADLTARLGLAELAPKIRVLWNPRMRSNAGLAFPTRCTIVLNSHLASLGSNEVNRTLRHELAHLIAHARAGRRRINPHGAEWKAACRDLGIADESPCHNLPLPRRKQTKRYFFLCPFCGKIYGRVRPLRRGRQIACGDCCRKYAGGRFSQRFQLIPVQQPNPNEINLRAS